MQKKEGIADKSKTYNWAMFAVVALIAIDQSIKYLINFYYPDLASKNTGIIFGFVDNNIWTLIFLALGFLILYFLIRGWKKLNQISQFGLVFIASGAISNLIDRLVYGGAIDYIHLAFWSSFNLADCYIVIGIILYGWQLLFKEQRHDH